MRDNPGLNNRNQGVNTINKIEEEWCCGECAA